MLHTRLILFIGDSGSSVKPLVGRLQQASPQWNLVWMDDIDTALAYADRAQLDGIFLGLGPSDEAGLNALETLCRGEPTAGVAIVVFGEGLDESTKARAIELGAGDLMGCPITLTDLRIRVRNLLLLRSCQDEMTFLADTVDTKARHRTGQLEIARLDALWRLAKACEYRNNETGDHVVRVGHCCRIIAESLAADTEFIETIFATSPLHDVGKIGVPDAILLKAGPLTADEFAVMARHCEIGANILVDAPKDAAFGKLRFRGRKIGPVAGEPNATKRMAWSIALNHHEWWDGSGYPRQLAGTAIPLEARIVAIADVYDALRSARPYKPAHDHTQAISVIKSETGAHFDPNVAAAFMESIDRIREMFASLSTEEPGSTPEAA